MEKLELKYLIAGVTRRHAYIQLPFTLIDHPAYADIECGAKILYALLLNRLALSDRHRENFSDSFGRIYIIYTIEQVIKDMNVSRPTAVKYLKSLHDKGLIKRVRQGQGKPTITYVMDFESVDMSMYEQGANKGEQENEQKSNNLTSRSKKSELQEVKKINCSKNDNIKNDISNNPSINNNSKSIYGKRKNVLLNKREYDTLRGDYGNNLEGLIDEVSDRIYGRSETSEPINNYYRYIQTIAKTIGTKTVAEEEEVLIRKRENAYSVALSTAHEGYEPDDKLMEILTNEQKAKIKAIAVKAVEKLMTEHKKQKADE